MEDQNNILNEFLERIKSLENSNKNLKESISKKKEELLKINEEISKPSNPEATKIVLSKKISTEKEGEIEGQKALQNYRSLRYNTGNIKENCEEYTIEYISQEQHNNLYIMGDFTKWELTPMKKTKDIFSYKAILLKGFKYYYSFQAGDQILLDYNNPYEPNPKNSQTQNFIDLNEPGKNVLFDCNKDINILQLIEKNYFLSQINVKEDEFLFLYKLKHHGTISREINIEAKEKQFNLFKAINTYYDLLYQNVNPYSKSNKFSILRHYLKNRILSKTYENNITYYYRIHNINENCVIESIKLYDNNHIKVNSESYAHSGFYYTIVPSNVTSIKSEENNKKYYLLPLEESQKILDEYNKDDKSIIKAYFKTLLNLKNNNSSNNNLITENADNIYSEYRRTRILVTPKKIEPEGINMDDYDFYYSLNQITKVRNKKEGSEVMFTVVDESAEKRKRPNRYEIYYSIKDNKINLIHFHVIDKDLRNVKMIIKEIGLKEDPHILKKDEEYIKNNQLLLIIQGQNILKLYYQGKKVKMQAFKIEENKLYLLQSPNSDSFFNRMYVTVENIKDKLNYDLIEQCNQFTYSLDNNMLNGVDVKVSFNSEKEYVTENVMLATSPCLLKRVTSYEEHTLFQRIPKTEKEKIKEKDKNNDNIDLNKNNSEEFNSFTYMTEIDQFFTIVQKMGELRKYKNKENIDKLTQDEKNKIIKELDQYSKAMIIIMEYIQANEMWENLDEATNITSEINDLMKLLNNK